MPFKTSDVDKHKKGLNSNQKKKWVSVANGVLDKCIKDGGTDKTCAPKAIRIANSKFSSDKDNNMKDFTSVPKKALSFLASTDAHCEFLKGKDEDTKDRFKMVGYSGEMIPNHWYWGNLIFDLNGFKFESDKYPILWAHERELDSILGYSTTPSITEEGLVFTENEVTFMDNEKVASFKKYSKEGMPFQSSIHGNPTKIEYIEDGVTTVVNGKEFVGPGHIWRETQFKECSVCVFGYDSHTSSQVFNEAEDEMVELSNSIFISQKNDKQTQDKLEKIMDRHEFKETHPEEYKKIVDLIVDEEKTKFDAEKRALIVEHETKVAEFTAKVTEFEQKVKELEKEKLVHEESSRKEFADRIWNEKLKEAEVPERLCEKVRSFVSAEKFVGENGFDETAFAEAVAKEVEFWAGSVNKDPIVQGSGVQTKTVAGENSFSDDKADSLADEMLALAGIHKENK